MNYTFFVEDMSCDHCKQRILAALEELGGVTDVSIDLVSKRVEATSDAPPRVLIKAFADAGYDAIMNEDG